MRSASLRLLPISLLLSLLLPGWAMAESVKDIAAERRLYAKKMQLVHALRPKRRDAPLRAVNISDSEVVQIQAQVRSIVPDALVNIGAVVTGCPCQNGPQCTDQVWVLADTTPVSRGLQLSRLDKQWTLGFVQQWWLQFEQLNTQLAAVHSTSMRQKLVQQRRTHILEFPACSD